MPDDSNIGPVHLDLVTQGLLGRDFEIPSVVLNPGQVKEALVDQFRGFNFLLFDDDRIVVF